MLGQRSLVFILSHFFFPGNILFRTYQSSMHTWYLRVGIYSGTEVKSSTAAAIQAALKPHPSPAGRLSGSRLGKIRDGLVTVRMYGYVQNPAWAFCIRCYAPKKALDGQLRTRLSVPNNEVSHHLVGPQFGS